MYAYDTHILFYFLKRTSVSYAYFIKRTRTDRICTDGPENAPKDALTEFISRQDSKMKTFSGEGACPSPHRSPTGSLPQIQILHGSAPGWWWWWWWRRRTRV